MATKADFTAGEWSLLRQAPTLAGLLVLVAEAGGELREVQEIARVYGDAREQWWAGAHIPPPVDEILTEGPELDRARFGGVSHHLDADRIREVAVTYVRDAHALLLARAGAEAAADYGRFVWAVAQRTGEAHREGGRLGGDRVSEREQLAIDEISAALGLTRPGAGAA